MKERTILKDRPWAQRNPRAFFGIFATTCLLMLYSRPIYDIFFREDYEAYKKRRALEQLAEEALVNQKEV